VAPVVESSSSVTNRADAPLCAEAMIGAAGDLSLDVLMRQALEVPGAASALLEAFAAQTRALRLVQEADARGAASLPTELRHRLEAVAARTPVWLAATSGGSGVRA
jgi:hypothetical protein